MSKGHTLTKGQDQGLRHADENGGTGTRRAAKPGFSSEGNPYQKLKTQRIWPTIFLKMGGLSPALSKLGGRVPPVPPCGGAPGQDQGQVTKGHCKYELW